MLVNKSTLINSVVLLFVFLLSSGIYYVTIPALIGIYLYLVVSKKILKINKKNIFVLILYFLSIGFSLFVGLFDSNFGESLIYSIYLFSLFLSLILLVSTESSKNTLSYIYVYVFGSFVFYSIVLFNACIYSASSLSCGYGEVYNLFLGATYNTPGYANSLVLYPVLCMGFLFFGQSNNLYKRIYFIFIIIFSIVLLSYLASRASYILLVLGLLMSLFLRGWKSVFSGALLLLGLATILYSLLGYMTSIEFISFDVMLDRFESKGLETQRVDRYFSGLEQLIKTPIGIYQIDPEVGVNNLIHNIYLDLAKFGGWIVFFSFFILSVLGFRYNPFRNTVGYKIIFLVYIVSLVSLQQDVFYGAGLPVLVVFLMTNTYLFCWGLQKNNLNKYEKVV